MGYNTGTGVYQPDNKGGVYEDENTSQHSELASRAETAALAASASQIAAAGSATGASTSATSATASAASATNSATTATTQAGVATTQAGISTTQATNASNSATSASTSATNASNSASTATTQATNASTSATNAATSASTATTQAGIATTQAGVSTTQAGISTTQAGISTTQAGIATTQATNASTSATAALASQNAAATSETNAATSATNASTSATNAASSASSASTSATTATAQAVIATTQATNASNSATSASTSASTATAQATTATTQAGIATTQATNASTSATNAASSESFASTSAGTATTQATNASNSATSASGSATTATTQAGIATTQAGISTTQACISTTQAGIATTQATNAATSASTATTQATSATNSASAALASQNAASTSETNAATSATNASNSASTATTQASNASTSATNASNSASTATTQAGISTAQAVIATTQAGVATTQATNASSSAAAALASQNTAQTASDAALAALDSFDDRYLGQKATNPTLDNDGNALVAGALYFNTTTSEMKVYSGSIWLNAYASLSGALLSTNNLSDLNNAPLARTNLGVTATGVDTTYAYRANNLSDLTSAPTARTNLGLGTAATTNSTAYATSAQGTTADTAYADRLKWDGGATGLTASTGRTSLELGSIATQAASSVAITGGAIDGTTVGATTASTGRFTSVTNSGLTSGRVTYAGASGLLSDSANLTFDGTNLLLNAANPNVQGTSSTGSATLINNSGGAFVRVYGGSHATRANYTDFINASSTSTFTSAGYLGVGTSNPIRPLQVGDYGISNGEITIASTTTGYGSILFGDGSTGVDYYRGYLQYNHNSDAMLLATSSVERMRITSAGSIVMNPTSATSGTVLDIYGGGSGALGALRIGDGTLSGGHVNYWDIGRDNSYTGDFYFHFNGSAKLRIGTYSVTSYGDFTAPIFYDSNTAYYGDFAGTSNLNALTIANGINNSSSYVNNGQLGLYNASYGGYFYQYGGTQWAATFNGNTDGSIVLRQSYNGNGKAYFYYDSSGSGLLTNTGNWGVRMNYDGGGTPGGTLYGAWTTTTIHTATQDMRAPLFYDTDTSYYGDFASTSRFNVVNATVLRSYENIYTDSNYGYGHVGVYASTRYQGIFAMADAYKLPADGTTTGNLYGIAWSHPNAGGAAGNLASHGMLILENGTFRGAWGGGSLRTTSNVYSPIYYDYDNPAYYLDPTGDSVLTTATFNANASSIIYITNGGTNASMIKAGAGDELYIGGNNTSQMRFSGGNVLMDNGGYFQNDQSIRSPIFYDTNTGYYWNLDGASNIGTVVSGTAQFLSNINTSGGTSNTLQAYSNNGGGAGMAFHRSGAYAVNFGLDSDNVMRIGGWSAPSNRWQLDMSGNNTVAGYMSSTIYYDNPNSSYYLDADSTSNLYNLNINGTNSKYLRITSTNSQEAMVYYEGGTGTQWYVGKRITAQLVSTADFHWYNVANNDTMMGLTVAGELLTRGGMYAPIFYDRDNPAYYVNPATTSNLDVVYANAFYGAINGMARDGNLINGMGPSTTWDPRPSVGYSAWSINYHTGIALSGHPSYGGVRLYSGGYPTHASSVLRLEASTGVYTYGPFTNDNSITAPIFYDTNTTYYMNINGTSNVDTIGAFALNTYNLTSQNAYTNNMDTTSSIGNGGMIRVLGQVGTNWTQILMSRPGVADSAYFFASDAWGPNGNAATEWLGCMSWTGRSLNATGTINASGSDYAEYMTKAGDFTIAKGDICGVDVNGKLTNVFTDAISFVVKSTKPSYVGGDEWGTEEGLGTPVLMRPLKLETETDEVYAQRLVEYEIEKPIFDAKLEAARQKVDRIAFSGQVPVNVTGAVSGQYIVPVNDNGAIKGIAINEDDLTMSQYIKSVGKVIKVVNGKPTIIVKVA